MEKLIDVVGKARIHGGSLEIKAREDAFFIIIAQAYAECALLGSAIHTQIELLVAPGLVEQILVVISAIKRGVIFIGEYRGIHVALNFQAVPYVDGGFIAN